MTSRAQILARVKENQPELKPLPPAELILSENWGKTPDTVQQQPASANAGQTLHNLEQFRSVLTTIGGALIEVPSYGEILEYLKEHYQAEQRIISTLPELSSIAEPGWENNDPHSLENVDLAIISAHFGVAENAALWITEDLMQQRVAPFICQQLAVVVSKNEILATMHDAYARIGEAEYGFGAFIAGPSKTADIEQSLVLGAHGPKGMTVFLIG
ncbi:LutC/YkgG family protein [Pedobacter ginsengisoli]|uniref:LutC/YkgG family protein n=1 Tax=Pedobacter ginsengisoli TaxID=363852 RepID=UPI00254A4C6B|nr:LUD domain-containing protein [Pedobacter ginsengisoli]